MVAGCPAKYAEGSFQTQARNFLFLSCVSYTLGMGNTHWVYRYSFYLTITIITHQDSNGTFPLLEHIPSCQVYAYGASYAAGGERQPCLPSAGIPVQIYFRTLKSQRFGNGSLPTLTHEGVNGKFFNVPPPPPGRGVPHSPDRCGGHHEPDHPGGRGPFLHSGEAGRGRLTLLTGSTSPHPLLTQPAVVTVDRLHFKPCGNVNMERQVINTQNIKQCALKIVIYVH